MPERQRPDAKIAILYKTRLYFTSSDKETYTVEEIVDILDDIIMEEETMSPKMGRPTDNPKPYKIAARIDEECKEILTKYCEQENINQNEAIRKAIKKLKAELKNN